MRHARSVFGSRAAGRGDASARRRRSPPGPAHARPAAAASLRRGSEGEGQGVEDSGSRALSASRLDRYRFVRFSCHAKYVSHRILFYIVLSIIYLYLGI